MARPQTAFPRAAAAAYGLLLLFSLAAVCYLLHARRIALPCAALTFVFLLLVPFGADFIYLLSKGMVHDLMIYAFFFCAVLPISLADRLQPPTGKAIRLAVPLAACCLSLVYFSDAIFANQFILRRDLCLQRDPQHSHTHAGAGRSGRRLSARRNPRRLCGRDERLPSVHGTPRL